MRAILVLYFSFGSKKIQKKFFLLSNDKLMSILAVDKKRQRRRDRKQACPLISAQIIEKN
jgi:hypothetical protein